MTNAAIQHSVNKALLPGIAALFLGCFWFVEGDVNVVIVFETFLHHHDSLNITPPVKISDDPEIFRFEQLLQNIKYLVGDRLMKYSVVAE